MALEYTGSIVLEVNSTEVEVTEFSPRETTGKKLVKTMNSTGRAKGYTQGIATWELSITAVVPVDQNINWAKIAGAKLTQYPLTGGKRTTYQDVFVTEVGEQYTVDNEARININAFALNKIEE
ncbi:phage tail protein [Serratia ureilytica]|uniref:phage tail protein n=1 Tax=Serratia ureilytica TaxID=300181 RepID=UPI0038C580BF